MHIFVTGSHGLIGQQLVSTLESSGHAVTRLVRDVPKNSQERCWETEGRRLSPTVLEGCDVLVHLAGESIAKGRWTNVRKHRIYHSRVDTTSRLATAIASMPTPPQAFIVASAVGYYGDRGEEVLTESSPSGSGFLADVCRDWEAAADPVRDLTRVVHVRTGVVLSQKGGAIKPMLLPFKLGVGGVIGSGQQYWSWITLEDIARLFQFAAEHETIVGPVNGTSPHPVTNREFTKALGDRLHRPAFFPMPGFLARVALGEMANELILGSTRALPDAALKHGFEFHHPELKPALASLPL